MPQRLDDADRILFGAAYYAEYQLEDRVETDLDLMAEAGFSVIRVGESVWSTWEPRDGEFELEWLAPVLDGAHARGISVILGTPTYAIPPWLQVKHPELAAESATGTRVPWGARQEVDYSSPLFRRYAERIVRAVVGRYAQHPAVVGYQVDNEPGLHLFHNEGAFAGFLAWLEARYGTPERLSDEWGLVYWSHRITSWDQLWRPDGNTLPQYDLAWRRYQAELTSDFIHWQAGIVREYARPEQFITTCIAYPRPALDDRALAGGLDVTAGNVYYGTRDRLDRTVETVPLSEWTTTGVAGLFRQADRVYSSRQERFLVTETNAQSISGSFHNYPPYPGQLQLAAFALVSRGAAMIEYWHWHTLHYGTETYWGGVLPHSQRPGRLYREASELGRVLRTLGPRLAGYRPDFDVTLLFSNDSKWAMEFFPPFARSDGSGDRRSYLREFDAFHRGVVDAGAQSRIVHAEQLLARSAAELAAQHPVLVVPGYYAASDDVLALLGEYATAGGHLVLGPRTAYADEEARARAEVAPPRLADAAGVSYEEYANLDEPVAVRASGELPLAGAAHATLWADGLTPADATVLAEYEHPDLGRFPAIVTRAVGAGRITTVGTVPDPALAAALASWLVPEPVASALVATDSPAVTVASGTTAAGERVAFVSNWSGATAHVTTVRPVVDAVSGETLGSHTDLSLEPWTARVLVAG